MANVDLPSRGIADEPMFACSRPSARISEYVFRSKTTSSSAVAAAPSKGE
jgi:hypothetical protein